MSPHPGWLGFPKTSRLARPGSRGGASLAGIAPCRQTTRRETRVVEVVHNLLTLLPLHALRRWQPWPGTETALDERWLETVARGLLTTTASGVRALDPQGGKVRVLPITGTEGLALHLLPGCRFVATPIRDALYHGVK